MASTYSPNLRIELIGTGDQSGLWGDTTNTNLGGLIEQAICGVEPITMVDTDYTLSALNGSPDEARNAVLVFTSAGALTASRNIFIPNVDKIYIVTNNTSGGQSLVVKVSGGSGVSVPAGKTAILYCDGTNCFQGANYFNNLDISTLTATTATITNLTATNLTLGSGTTGTGSYVRQTSPTITTPTINTPTINGGTITGITDLAVADGGTGASDQAGAQANLNVPSRTGTGASGTWGINISGNAATVTNGVYNNGSTYGINITGNSGTATTITSTTPSLGYSLSGQDISYGGQGGSMVLGQGGSAAMLSFHRPGAYAINFGLGTDNQLRTGGWSRGGSYVVLDSGNYNGYAPTLTGGNASGTWGINISGNAATATNATNAANATSATTLTGNWTALPAGTRLLFAQASAPTGWTQVTGDEANNRMLRVISTTGGGTGGVHDPVINNVVPYHTHGYSGNTGGQSADHAHYTSGTTGGMNGNNPHSHSVYDPGHNHSYTWKTTIGGDNSGGDVNQINNGTFYTGSSSTNIGINATDINHSHNWGNWSGGVNSNHTHGFSGTTDGGSSQTNWTPRYINVIMCSKN